MKKECIKTFKQVYKDKVTGKEREFSYRMGIVKDTEDYTFRLINLDEMAIWKRWRFTTYEQAENFLDRHPHNVDRKE